MTTKPVKVLCCLDYFLPGYAGGGPVRTIANMRKLLAGKVELEIFTRDRDLAAAAPYAGITVDDWNEAEGGRVFYASPKMFSALGFKQCVEQERYDLLYLNSFFSPRSSIQPYLWSRQARPDLPILLAPRGEFSLGALALKRMKKCSFLKMARIFGLYRDVQWHASTSTEKEDILRQFPSAESIYLAEDPVTVGYDQPLLKAPPYSEGGALRIVFISRISRMKNLDGLLRIMAKMSLRAQLDIYGPIEDQAYWRTCEDHIIKLPPQVSAIYKGPLAPEAVSSVFAAYDLFAFPTLGENFGHVVFESLRAGTPVLLSDRTPWSSTGDGVITTIPLDDTDVWRSELHRAAARNDRHRAKLRTATRDFAEYYASTSGALARNLDMFRMAAAAERVTALPSPGWASKRVGGQER